MKIQYTIRAITVIVRISDRKYRILYKNDKEIYPLFVVNTHHLFYLLRGMGKRTKKVQCLA